MCGIFGILGTNASVDPDLLERGTQSLAHRGPDDSGTVLLRVEAPLAFELGLGNRRLAILDLSPLGHQPMQDPDTGNWIVYNGEIYNFRDVRSELEREGKSFSSHSDTEVVLKAYAYWGEHCFEKFRGMFALAIWDADRRRLLLARDPMGIKPLYYAQAGSFFLFASEVRALLGTGLLPRRLEHASLVNYLTFGSAYDPLTPVEGIRSLPAGHLLTLEQGTPKLTQYWQLVDQQKPPEKGNVHSSSEEQVVRSLQPLLEEAVRLQLVSDVPVGVFLSGGIDSSALVSILSRGGLVPSTFSVVFHESEYSEAQFSRTIAKRFHTDHHEINVSEKEVLASLEDALRAMDLPTMDAVNTFFVSRAARKAGVKVALSGLGGDEIFAGYSSFRTVPQMERFSHAWRHVPNVVRATLAAGYQTFSGETDQNRKLASLVRGNGRTLHPYFLSRMLFSPRQQDLLFPHGREEWEFAQSAPNLELERSQSLDAVNRVSYLESRCYMLNTLLRDADFMSMSQGLELRVPLIDHQLAKAVLAVPGHYKLNGIPKKLLVKALAGTLPEEVVHRPKRGFTLPFEHWLRQELRSEIEPVLSARRIDAGPLANLLQGDQVQQIWQSFLRKQVSWSRPWSLYVLQRWCEMHL